jgi:hypothetical protein
VIPTLGYAVFFIFVVFVMPPYFLSKVLASSMKDPLARGAMAVLLSLLLEGLLCFAASVLFIQGIGDKLILSVAVALNLLGMVILAARYRKRVQEA